MSNWIAVLNMQDGNINLENVPRSSQLEHIDDDEFKSTGWVKA